MKNAFPDDHRPGPALEVGWDGTDAPALVHLMWDVGFRSEPIRSNRDSLRWTVGDAHVFPPLFEHGGFGTSRRQGRAFPSPNAARPFERFALVASVWALPIPPGAAVAWRVWRTWRRRDSSVGSRP